MRITLGNLIDSIIFYQMIEVSSKFYLMKKNFTISVRNDHRQPKHLNSSFSRWLRKHLLKWPSKLIWCRWQFFLSSQTYISLEFCKLCSLLTCPHKKNRERSSQESVEPTWQDHPFQSIDLETVGLKSVLHRWRNAVVRRLVGKWSTRLSLTSSPPE